MIKRIAKVSSVEVNFIGDDDVIEHITTVSHKKKGQKKSDIIYDHIKNDAADTSSQYSSDDEYHPSSVLVSEENEIHGQKLFKVTPKSSRAVSKKHNLLKSSRKKSVTFSPKVERRKFNKESPVSSLQNVKSYSRENGKPTKHTLRIRKEQIDLNDAESDPENSDDDSWEDESSSCGPDMLDEPISHQKQPPKVLDNGELRNCPQDYFEAQKKSSFKTSNKTLSKVTFEQTNIQDLKTLLRSTPQYHRKEKTALLNNYATLFDKWNFLLLEGFSILLCGIGSKIPVLHNFCSKILEHELYIVINGFFPSLTIKQVLSSITGDIMDHEGTFSNIGEQAEFIKKYFSSSDEHLYIVVHNIDGPALRGTKHQSILSSLATCPNIHYIASVDHINCSLIWDQIMLSQFRWIWFDVTTHEPYLLETSYQSTLFSKQSSHLLLSSILHVFQSLTPNGRGVFLLLANYQNDSQSQGNYLGITFHEWYQECREAFLVNSELTMNAQLSEFKNHKLLASRKGADGIEYWYIPVDSDTLSQFLEKADDT